MFQNFNLFPHLTVLENIIEAPVVHKIHSRERAKAVAYELLDTVGLRHKADAYPRHLSGGQQQRIAIARALALNPKVILFDEPTSALDPELVGEVLDVIKGLADLGVTLVVVTHEIGFAREAADRVVFMVDGQIVEQGDAKQVLAQPQHPRTVNFQQSDRQGAAAPRTRAAYRPAKRRFSAAKSSGRIPCWFCPRRSATPAE